MEFDVFVSHASEDKPYVEPLVRRLEAAGVRVWYDRSTLEWGDDLRRSIDHGLGKSRFGIVIFSPAFLKRKKWTEYELSALFSREGLPDKIVLPIWHNVTREDLLQYSPAFADRLAKISSSDSIEDIVSSLLRLLGTSEGDQPGGNTDQSDTGGSRGLTLPQQVYLLFADPDHSLFKRENDLICFAAGLIELDQIGAIRLLPTGVWVDGRKAVPDIFLDRIQGGLAAFKTRHPDESIFLSHYFGAYHHHKSHQRLIDQLLSGGLIAERQERVLGLFKETRYVLADAVAKAAMKERIRAEILGERKMSDTTRALISVHREPLAGLLANQLSALERTALSLGVLKAIDAWPSKYDKAVQYVLAQEPSGSTAGMG